MPLVGSGPVTPPPAPSGGIQPVLNYVQSGSQGSPSASGCTNSIVNVISSGSTHDMGGAAASTPNGSNPATAAGTYTFWQDVAGQFEQVIWSVRVDLEPAGGAGHFWALQGNIQNQSNGAGNVWYSGLQTKSALAGNPKALIFSVWNAVDAIAGDIAGTLAQTFGGEGEGYQVLAPFTWAVGVTYTFRMARESTRGSRWFGVYVTPSNTGLEVWLGSIRASTADSSYVHGVAYQWVEPFISANPNVATCPLLPRSTAFLGIPSFYVPPAPPPVTGGTEPTSAVFATLSKKFKGWRKTGFRYDLLDVDMNYKKTIGMVSSKSDRSGVQEAEIQFNGENDVMRTASFELKDDPDINWYSDKIQPWFLALDEDTGEFTEYPLGVFSFLSPPRNITSYGSYRTIEGFDLTQDLDNSFFAVVGNINTIPEGNSLPKDEIITVAVEKIILNGDIDISSINLLEIVPADDLLGAVRQWELGSSRLEAVNGLLDQVGYYPLHTDGYSRLKSRPIPQFEFATPNLFYVTDDDSWVKYPVTDSIVQNRIWNQVLLLAENPASNAKYSSLLTNNRTDSPISVAAIGRVLWAPPETLQDITSQAQLDKVAEVRLQQGADLFQVVEFETPIEPEPEAFNVVQVEVGVPDQPDDPVEGNFVERQWTIQCRPGGTMRHTFHRIIPTVDVVPET